MAKLFFLIVFEKKKTNQNGVSEEALAPGISHIFSGTRELIFICRMDW
jgi:hypothetical protein